MYGKESKNILNKETNKKGTKKKDREKEQNNALISILFNNLQYADSHSVKHIL